METEPLVETEPLAETEDKQRQSDSGDRWTKSERVKRDIILRLVNIHR